MRIVARVTGLKGECAAGHKVGDEFEVSHLKSSGLCGIAYLAVLPFITAMEFGGKAPWQEDPSYMGPLACPDGYNVLTLELRKVE